MPEVTPSPAATVTLVRDSPRGVEVLMLEEDGPAQNAGLWIEDVIVAFAGRVVTNVDDLHRTLTQVPVGVPASVVVLREGRWVERSCVPATFGKKIPESVFHLTDASV